MATLQVSQVERDLDQIPDENFTGAGLEDPEIFWDEARGELSIGGKTICSFRRQARKIRAILKEIQEKKWLGEGIKSPLTDRSPNALTQALRDLRRKTGGHLPFSENLGRVTWVRL